MTERRVFNVLDVFSGAGGLALGFEAVGCRSIGALDIDEDSAGTFSRVFAGHGPVVFGGGVDGDARSKGTADRLVAALPTPPDIVVGGPPCQGFSQVGRAKNKSLLEPGAGTLSGGVRNPERNQLYRSFLDFVAKSNAMAFVMENVPGIRSLGGTDYARRIAAEASRTGIGFTVRYFLLNAAHFGVPQSRWRIFFVGIRNDLGVVVPRTPIRTHRCEVDLLEGTATPSDKRMVWGEAIPEVADPKPGITVRDALDDLPKLYSMPENGQGIERYDSAVALPYRKEPSEYGMLMRSWPGRDPVHEVTGHWYRATPRDFRIFREMVPGDRYPDAFQRARKLFVHHLRKMAANGTPGPEPGSEEYLALRRQFVPPYRRDSFPEKWGKLIPGQPSWTLPAHLSRDSYSHIHYDGAQARTITIREAARLQGFPDFVRFVGNNGSQFRQIGNAVPPPLAIAVAKSLTDQLHEVLQGQA